MERLIFFLLVCYGLSILDSPLRQVLQAIADFCTKKNSYNIFDKKLVIPKEIKVDIETIIEIIKKLLEKLNKR